MALELVVVDAFTDQLFSGNPAAVCLLDEFPKVELMQAIAAEMNLAETAFAVRRRRNVYDLRWFTPTLEVDLCGHATLATVHVLGRRSIFRTRSGPLACVVDSRGFIEMDFPADPPSEAKLPTGSGLDRVEWFGRGRLYQVALLETAAEVREFRPNFELIRRVFNHALILTAPGDRPGIDCVSRFFAPALGVPEDPVTGSAHCTLAPFWEARLKRSSLTGEQASRRGGVVYMRSLANRVAIGGTAVTVSRVELLI